MAYVSQSTNHQSSAQFTDYQKTPTLTMPSPRFLRAEVQLTPSTSMGGSNEENTIGRSSSSSPQQQQLIQKKSYCGYQSTTHG